MIIEVLMPSLSPTMKSGSITKWYKKEGDKVKSGEIIADIETDKATMEFEYIDEDGIIAKILFQEGSKGVAINELIALIITEEDKDLELLNDYQKSQTGNDKKNNQEKKEEVNKKEILANDLYASNSLFPNNKRLIISPLARRIALNEDIDISLIKGTGPYNRIIKKDILNEIDNRSSNSIQTNKTHITQGNLSEVSSIRQSIAKRLLESKQTVPHFYLTVDCNVNNLILLRSDINKNNKDNKVTINDFIIKAVSLSIKRFSDINTSWIDGQILHYTDIDISVAVSLEDGLITPIIKKADKKSLKEISTEVKELVTRAKKGKLRADEFQGGGFTISNLGMFSVKQFNAIINPPQSCILAVGASEKRVIVGDDNDIKIANIMTVTLSVDHRTIDGVLAASFLECFKNYIESPLSMLI